MVERISHQLRYIHQKFCESFMSIYDHLCPNQRITCISSASIITLHSHLESSRFCDVFHSLERLVLLAIEIKARHLQPRDRHLTYGK